MEKLIETFLLKPRHLAFRKRYGQNVRVCNKGCEGFISGWHPKIPHDKVARWVWCFFDRSPSDTDPTSEIVKPLVGKQVIVLYRALNAHRPERPRHTLQHEVRIVSTGPRSMCIEKVLGNDSFTMCYAGVVSIWLYVDYLRQGTSQHFDP